MDLDALFKIIDKLSDSCFQEAYIRYKDTAISLKKASGEGRGSPAETGAGGGLPVSRVSDENSQHTAPVLPGDGLQNVLSPITGVFYLAPDPDSPPFVEPGSAFRKGQVLCIIESMKLMNEIRAAEDGLLVDRLVKNGELVNANQPIFVYRSIKKD
ncbi:MAG: acetyl-CoA carboxylase biotin carboxyl carrier protein [Christensenellales bacterium]|jgi:biotin carboxyl carrier protein